LVLAIIITTIIVCRTLLSEALTASSHPRKFELLLQLEEVQMEVDIRKYDLCSTQLTQYKANRRLLTLEVVTFVDYTPYLQKTAKLFLSQVR